jgi:hypothetical protein
MQASLKEDAFLKILSHEKGYSVQGNAKVFRPILDIFQT